MDFSCLKVSKALDKNSAMKLFDLVSENFLNILIKSLKKAFCIIPEINLSAQLSAFYIYFK
jgi:hypothetical protein